MADVKNDKMIGVDENDKKPELEDATHNKVDDFNEYTFDLCVYVVLCSQIFFLNLMIIFWKLKRLMLEMIGVDENDNKPEQEDASHDNVDDSTEDTCEVYLYNVENVVRSTENIVEVQELFEDNRN